MHGVYNPLRLWRFLIALHDQANAEQARLLKRLDDLKGAEFVMLSDDEEAVIQRLCIEHNKTVGDYA